MNHAIEHLNQGIAVTERRLQDAKANQKMLQGQADEQGVVVEMLQKTIVDLRAALAVVRSPGAGEIPAPDVISQIEKSELNNKSSPRAVLSRKGS